VKNPGRSDKRSAIRGFKISDAKRRWNNGILTLLLIDVDISKDKQYIWLKGSVSEHSQREADRLICSYGFGLSSFVNKSKNKFVTFVTHLDKL
jgi:hypothetical protein